jgi:predicted Zn finger-like uncharacterized protein
MPTQLKSHCPHCHAVLKVDDSLVGKRVRCPACKTSFELKSVQFAPGSPSLEQAPQASETIVPASSDTSRAPDLYPPRDSAGKSPTLGQLGRFELKELLGQGAFGKVYRAYDPQLERFVALKVPTFGPDDKHLIQRFTAEAKAAARLRHPNIVPVFDTGNDNGQLFIASAFIEGQTLAARLDHDRPDFREAARLVMALASALDCAHGQGIVHRDVKPANIMLDSKGVPLLMDFGLARIRESDHKLTYDGSVLGTPAYMAPEQAAGKLDQVGPASDQYSLGVVLYELLTGKRPFEGPAAVVIAQVIAQNPVSPSTINAAIPSDLETICLKALSKALADRYPTCQALADDLGRWLASESIQARQPLAARLFRWSKAPSNIIALVSPVLKRRWTLRQRIAAGTVGGALAGVLLGVMILLNTPRDQIRNEPEKISTTEDRVKNKLHVAKEAFDREEKQLRNEVVAALKKSIEGATNAGNVAQAEQARTELDAFMSKNELPKTVQTTAFQEEMRHASVRLKDAYQSAIAQYVLEEKVSEATSTKMDLQAFLKASVIGMELGRKELLANPGCEEGVTMGRISGWLAVRGDWKPAGSFLPREGNFFFRTGQSADAELRQDVSVRAATEIATAPDLKYTFSGYVHSYDQDPPDTARIVIECRDATNQQALDVFDSGAIGHVKGWKQIVVSRVLPPGTETIRVRLIAHRRGKGTRSNNAYFDALSLRVALN